MLIEIKNARKEQAAEIAGLIMMAMTDDCCLHFCGAGHGLDDFRRMMTLLVERDDSQYSYRNTLVAMVGDKVVGVAVSYDGGRLHELRQAFIEAAECKSGKIIQVWTTRHRRGTLFDLAGCATVIPTPGHCPATQKGH